MLRQEDAATCKRGHFLPVGLNFLSTLYSVLSTVHTVHIKYAQLALVNAELFLSTGNSTPMYQQIVDQVTAKVMAGDWQAGQALPSIRELASANRVSVITVKRAYADLGLAGIIVTRHGMGSFVAESPHLPTELLRAEFTQHFDAMLVRAARLGMSRDEIRQLLADEPTDPASDSAEGSTP
jgi:GntR family transcriptional regulator